MGVHLYKRSNSSASSSSPAIPPKGCMAVRVVGPGPPGGEEPQKFVVPLGYLNHPLFVGLLKEAEEEFGFEQQGAITIPCGVENFRRVQGIIEGDVASHHGHGHGGGGGHQQQHLHHHHHRHFHIAGCFRA